MLFSIVDYITKSVWKDYFLGVPIAGVALSGAIWALGLARLMAEVGFLAPTYASPPSVAGITCLCVVAFLALWRRMRHWPSPHFPDWSILLPLAFPLPYVVGLIQTPLSGGTLLIGGAVLALLLAWGDRAPWLPPAALGLITFVLYLRTLLPSIGQADTFEFQVIVPRLGVAHPTGYPLYVILSKLFTLLPLGNVAWRVNLASAVFAVAAVLALYALLLRLTSRWLPAFLSASAFAFSFTFWSQAIVAEVYTLHNLLVALILWLLLSRFETTEIFGNAALRWQALFLLSGASFANHLTTALLLPAVALALLWERPRLRLKDWLIGGMLLLLGLSIYLFIPLRWPALNHGEWMTLSQFITHITGGQFHAALQLGGWRDPTRWRIIWRILRQPFGIIGLALALFGVGGLAVRHRRTLTLTGVTFLAFLFYGLNYHVPDISVFLLPAHLVLALWIGAGIAALVDALSALSSPSLAPCLILCALLPLSRIWLNLPLVDQSRNQGSRAWGRYVLSLPLAEGSAVLADTEKFAPLYYLQQIEGVRPDLDLLLLGNEELYREELLARLKEGQPVYLARYLPHLEKLHLRSVGPLVEVRDQAFAEKLTSDGASANFGERILLLDAEVSADTLGRELYHLTLYWRAKRQVNDDLIVHLRLVNPDGRSLWESDGVRPVGGLYPTNAWPVGATIADYHALSLPPWLPRGEYELEVGLFPPFSDTGLKIGDEAKMWLGLGAVEVKSIASHPPLPHERRCLFTGGAWLIGYDLAGETFTDAPFLVDLAWRGVEMEEQVSLTWVDGRGRSVEASIFPLAAGTARSRHTIPAPRTPGRHTLRVGLADQSTHCDWLATPTDDCSLAAVEVAPSQEGLANFAGQMLLLGAEIEETNIQSGSVVPVTLRWRALREMEEDYTAFVHLIGPYGQLRGQVDMWPVHGSHPTTQWTQGEEIDDPYEVRLSLDAPPGRYRVEVGWYLLATMQRLQILDANGRSTGDSFVIGEFDVVDSQ